MCQYEQLTTVKFVVDQHLNQFYGNVLIEGVDGGDGLN
jgi:hypothetical protein